MRLFIGIDVNDEIRKNILKEIENIRYKGVDVDFTDPENLHITLKFLGEVSDKQADEIKDTLTKILSIRKRFDVNIKGMGFFGRPEFIKIVWLGIEEGKSELVNIIEALNSIFKRIKTEDHDPHPHITIGRVKTGKNKDILLHEIKSKSNLEIGKMKVKEIKLKKSELTRKGPVYSDLLTIKLKK